MVAEMGRAWCPAVYAAGLNRRHHPPLLEAFPAKNGRPWVGRKGTVVSLLQWSRRTSFYFVVNGSGV